MNPELLEQLRRIFGGERQSTPLPPMMTVAQHPDAPTIGPRRASDTRYPYTPPPEPGPVRSALEMLVGATPAGAAPDVARAIGSGVRGDRAGVAAGLAMAGAGMVPMGKLVPDAIQKKVVDAVSPALRMLTGAAEQAPVRIRVATKPNENPFADPASFETMVAEGRRIAPREYDRSLANDPNFSRWFRNSTARYGDTGVPKVMTHGTAAGDITAPNLDTEWSFFRLPRERHSGLGIHVAEDPRQSSAFSTYDEAPTFETQLKKFGRTFPLFVRAENPLRTPDLQLWRGPEIAGHLQNQKVRGTLPEALQSLTDRDIAELSGKYGRDAGHARAWLKDKGYDSIVYRNRYEGVPGPVWQEINKLARDRGMFVSRLSDEDWLEKWPDMGDAYILLDPRQVKSAIGNSGEFGRSSNIYRSGLLGLLAGGTAAGAANEEP